MYAIMFICVEAGIVPSSPFTLYTIMKWSLFSVDFQIKCKFESFEMRLLYLVSRRTSISPRMSLYTCRFLPSYERHVYVRVPLEFLISFAIEFVDVGPTTSVVQIHLRPESEVQSGFLIPQCTEKNLSTPALYLFSLPQMQLFTGTIYLSAMMRRWRCFYTQMCSAL